MVTDKHRTEGGEMCTAVMVKWGEKYTYCETVGKLAETLGVSPESVSKDGPEFCLCNARFEELGARKATEAETDDWGICGDRIIELPEGEL